MSSVRSVITILLVSGLLFFAGTGSANAQIISYLSGIVVDQNGALLPGVEITLLSSDGTLERTVVTDEEGFFSFPVLPLGEYSLKLSKDGFDPSEIPSLSITEEKARQLRIELQVNALSETIKVQSEPAAVDENKTSASVFERALVENLPLNGRNHQTLIALVPGVVIVPVDDKNLGQFSANGQRTNANFFMVDGVPANFGTTNYDFLGQTASGSIPSFNIQGGLDNLVSSEALEEVRIQTPDFSPATGRAPGATVSFLSRSGKSDYSFSFFENFRNGTFNAADYFDIEKPPHDFNDFGGFFSGPLSFPGRKAGANYRTYFFLSAESRRFTLPQPTVTLEVPSLEIRDAAQNPVAQAIYNSFPLPDEKEQILPRAAENVMFPESSLFRATYADPNGAESYNLRVDHLFNPKLSFFARFNYSPSFSENRNPLNLSSLIASDQTTQTATFGSTQAFSARVVNEFRFNSSVQTARTNHDFDGLYGGVLPDRSIFIPAAFEAESTHFRFSLNGFSEPLSFFYGDYAQNEMRQLSLSDNLTYAVGSHELKLGFDYRRLSPTLRVSGYGINYDFDSLDAVALGTASRVAFYKNPNVSTNVLSVSSFVQDNWKVNSKVNLLYGLRWEINPAPSAADRTMLQRTLEAAPDLAQTEQNGLKLAPEGTPYYRTDLGNFAPRFGAAIHVYGKSDRQIVLRAGFGTFYDLGQSQFSELASPFQHTNGATENLALPVNNLPSDFFSNIVKSNKRLTVVAADSDYRLPRTYFWNFAAQLKTGDGQLFSASYVGAAGRQLQRTLTLDLASSNEAANVYFSESFSKIVYIDNAFSSDYHAFQFQYSRNLSGGLRSFVNYTWSHSIDDNSSDSGISTPFLIRPVADDRGNSDFDARHAVNAGFSYNLPPIKSDNALGKFLSDWTLSGIFFARTGLPFDVRIAELNPLTNQLHFRRAEIVGSLPFFVKSAESPTGVRINADAFTRPAGRGGQGNLGRNVFIGPFVWQLDSSLSKRINLTKKLRLQLGIEVYNVFNRPNFSNPQAEIFYRSGERIVPEDFGVPTRTMARGYASAEPTGGVSPVFQLGGARSMQFNARISF